jgi:uncharacterized protein YndB with AHSA1/START domain
MRQLTARFELDAEPEQVYDVIADPRRHTEWQAAVRDVVAVSGRGGGVGSSYSAIYRVAGRPLEARFVVTAADRPRFHQVTGSSTAGRATWTTAIEAAPGRGRTTVEVVLGYEPAGNLVGGMFALVTGRRIARDFRRTYANLLAIVEREARAARDSQLADLLPTADREAATG